MAVTMKNVVFWDITLPTLHSFPAWGGNSLTHTTIRNAADQEDQATVYPSFPP
jgi:hypothetical protein